MNFLTTSVTFALIACSIVASAEEGDRYIEFRDIYIQSFQEHGAEVSSYLKESIEYIEQIDNEGKCSDSAEGIISLMLVIDETGMVNDVALRDINRKARCFSAAFLEQQFPEPPFVPFYLDIELR